MQRQQQRYFHPNKVGINLDQPTNVHTNIVPSATPDSENEISITIVEEQPNMLVFDL